MDKNPFSVTNPESLTHQHIASLYVNVIDDMSLILSHRHTFIHGLRGTGKSMLLRFLEPEVQVAAKKYKSITELPFFAVHIPLRNSTFISEIRRLKGDLYNYFAEHFLVSLILAKFFDKLSSIYSGNDISTEFFSNFLKKRLQLLGCKVDNKKKTVTFADISKLFEEANIEANQYLRRLWAASPSDSYTGALFGYLDLLLPTLDLCKQFNFLPDAPFFLMLDDADNTPQAVQRILNTWVSCRTSDTVCLKISTQMGYKTFITTAGKFIENPHDYCEVDLTTIYSPATSDFGKRIKEILDRRFQIFEIAGTPEDFFPVKMSQEKAIKKIAAELKKEHAAGAGRGFRASDDVVRYARVMYMTQLAGTKKASSKYSYAGFDSIANLANGVIRWFLEPASQMYNKQKLKQSNEAVTSIPVGIQDEILLAWSEAFIKEGLARIKEVQDGDAADNSQILADNTLESSFNNCSYDEGTAIRLFKMIDGLGKVFRKILLSESRSERRVFSFMLATEPSTKLQKVLDLGVEWGYLQQKYIGDKEGLGRKPQYILSRRLAPFYKLDASGFAGNLSVTSEHLELACMAPDAFVRERLAASPSEPKAEQLPLFQG